MKKICITEGRNSETIRKRFIVLALQISGLVLLLSNAIFVTCKPLNQGRILLSLYLDYLNTAKMRIILIIPKRAPNKTGAVYMFS